MLKAPNGLWGLVLDRWNLPFFPVQLRVRRFEAKAAPQAAGAPASGSSGGAGGRGVTETVRLVRMSP
jgi:hypothetical protein